ncbi:hypothetical protein SB690_20015, partial [Bacillus sp. SIMBA_006]|uniref:hypothetical protein n=1 Tax=Bacillus sp. SIMBA_006 TaxID=3085755 RepID=UPI00397BB7A8
FNARARVVEYPRHLSRADQIGFDRRDMCRNGMAVHTAALREVHGGFARARERIPDDCAVERFIRGAPCNEGRNVREDFTHCVFGFGIRIT